MLPDHNCHRYDGSQVTLLFSRMCPKYNLAIVQHWLISYIIGCIVNNSGYDIIHLSLRLWSLFLNWYIDFINFSMDCLVLEIHGFWVSLLYLQVWNADVHYNTRKLYHTCWNRVLGVSFFSCPYIYNMNLSNQSQ